jgi:molecular chaperone Hsp33
MSQMLEPDLSVVELRSYFVRKRNALLVRGRFSPLYLDYYLHLMQHALQNAEALDQMLKDALAALALHLCSRPQDESCAWTIHVKEPQRANVFVTGSTRPGRVTGRVFTEDVRQEGEAMFIAQTTRPDHQPRQSMIEFHGDDMLKAVETFYTTSEQRLTRFFRLEDEEFVQISAEPDCDEIWLSELALENVLELETTEHLTLLETRGYMCLTAAARWSGSCPSSCACRRTIWITFSRMASPRSPVRAVARSIARRRRVLRNGGRSSPSA